MSFRKTKLIQERNILLERKHILEQGVVPTPAQPASPSPVPAPSTPNTTQPSNEVKFEDVEKFLKDGKFCSKQNSKLDKNTVKEIEKNGKKLFYYLGPSGSILCVDDERKN